MRFSTLCIHTHFTSRRLLANTLQNYRFWSFGKIAKCKYDNKTVFISSTIRPFHEHFMAFCLVVHVVRWYHLWIMRKSKKITTFAKLMTTSANRLVPSYTPKNQNRVLFAWYSPKENSNEIKKKLSFLWTILNCCRATRYRSIVSILVFRHICASN